MISSKRREIRRGKTSKLSKNLERTYKAKKCRECKVVVTRMDFAKILGKFTKVKIQYESSSTSKLKHTPPPTSPSSNARLKKNENGMVLIRRHAYNQHPVRDLASSKKPKSSEIPTRSTLVSRSIQPDVNILKENNRLKRTPPIKVNVSNDNHQNQIKSDLKQYGIIFVNPSTNNINDKNKITLIDLLPFINKNILPSDEWCIDYFPKSEEPKDDKVYDRIAAELEDLMYNEKKHSIVENKSDILENNPDDFPSIMDILNDNSTENSFKTNENVNLGLKPNLESSDVEAMLLGKSNEINKIEVCPLVTDNGVAKDLIEDVEHLATIQESSTKQEANEESPGNQEPLASQESLPNQETMVNQESAASQESLANPDTSESPETLANPEPSENLNTSTNLDTSTNQASLLNQESLEDQASVVKPETLVDQESSANHESSPSHETSLHEEPSTNQEPLANQESAPSPESFPIQQVNNKSEGVNKVETETLEENPNSPSILDETLRKGIEEHLPAIETQKITSNGETEEIKNSFNPIKIDITPMEIDSPEEPNEPERNENSLAKTTSNQDVSLPRTDVTHVVFNNMKNEKCIKSVTCPKNLKYTIELNAKLVEFIGAPKCITSLEDLQVLLQIVNDSELDSLHVSHL